VNALPAQYELPHNGEAEASILGAVILRNETLAQLEELEVGDFYDHKHKVVFAAIRNLAAARRPIDVVLLEAEIERVGKLEAIGGIAFLGELCLTPPTVDNVDHYARIVKRDARNRRVAIELSSAMERLKREVYEPDEVLAETIGELQRIAEERPRREVRVEARLLSELADDIIQQSAMPEMDWGIEGLNRLAPIQVRSMGTLVGPTGAGKTALAMTMGAHRARYGATPGKRQGPTVYMLFELTAAQFAARRASQLSRFTWRQILGGVMAVHEIQDTLGGEHFYVVKPPRRVNVIDYAQRVLDEVAKRSPGVPLLVFDYLQRIKGDGKDLRIDVSNIVDSIVDLVESRDMYGLLLSKGSRVGSKSMRDGKSRGEALVDVAAEASAIEAGSAALLAITYENRDGGDITDARIEVAKGRFGATGASVPMRFHGATGLWQELTEATPLRSEREAEQRVLAAMDRTSDGFESRTEIHKAATGNKAENLAAIRRLLAPNGPIEIRDGRIHKRRS